MPRREEKKAESRRRILESARDVFFRDGFMLSDFFQEKTADRLDNRQGLVQFMRDTRGHLPEGGHFAGLDKLLFGFQAFGDVTGGYQKDFAAGIFGRGYADVDVT